MSKWLFLIRSRDNNIYIQRISSDLLPLWISTGKNLGLTTPRFLKYLPGERKSKCNLSTGKDWKDSSIVIIEGNIIIPEDKK